MKPRTKVFLQISVPVIGTVVLTTLFTCVSGILVNVPTVSIGGSTAILPLMNTISNSYSKVDIVTSAGGSGMGINSIIEGTKEIGMASKNPGINFNNTNDKKTKLWIEKKIKTLTFAYDGIGIVYKPSNPEDKIINVDEETLAKIYACFSGISKITLGDLTGNINDKTPVIPFARNGGANVSGTADGFLRDSHIAYENSKYWIDLGAQNQSKVKTILETGDYGSNVIQTAEANSQTWNRVKNGNVGSIAYLSSGFIINNVKEIEAAGFKVATYKGLELNGNVSTGYDWYRPFNLIYSINHISNNDGIKEFLNWLITSQEAKNIIKTEGYTNLENTSGIDLFKSDFELWQKETNNENIK